MTENLVDFLKQQLKKIKNIKIFLRNPYGISKMFPCISEWISEESPSGFSKKIRGSTSEKKNLEEFLKKFHDVALNALGKNPGRNFWSIQCKIFQKNNL